MQRVLIMGLGRGTSFARAARNSQLLRLAGLIDVDAQSLRLERENCGLDDSQIFNSFDAAVASAAADILVVATPTHLHTQHVIGGLRTGLHVLCEKPLTTCRQEALFMRDESRRCGRQLAVVQNVRYGPQFRRCRQLIAEGLIGPLARIQLDFVKWRDGRFAHPHAILFNHGVHYVDLVRYLTGAAAREIHAIEWDPPDSVGNGGGRLLRLTALTDSGFVVCFDGSYVEAGLSSGLTLRISGARGTLHTNDVVEQPELWLWRNAQACAQDVRERISVEAGDWHNIDCQLLEGFAQSIERGHRTETDIEDNLQTLDWVFRASESIERGVGAKRDS